MSHIFDAIWAQVIEAERRLPTEARIELEDAIRAHLEYNKAEPDGVVLETRDGRRRTLRRIKSTRQRLSYELTRLGRAAVLDDIDAPLRIEEERLSKRRPKNWLHNELRRRYGPLITELLEIWGFYLKIDVPTQAAETVNSGRYHKFLEVFLELVEPHARKAELKEMLKAGLDFAVEVNQARRNEPIYCWQWNELYPQTYESLFMSSKYRAE
jgi:hypothetical protein